MVPCSYYCITSLYIFPLSILWKFKLASIKYTADQSVCMYKQCICNMLAHVIHVYSSCMLFGMVCLLHYWPTSQLATPTMYPGIKTLEARHTYICWKLLGSRLVLGCFKCKQIHNICSVLPTKYSYITHVVLEPQATVPMGVWFSVSSINTVCVYCIYINVQCLWSELIR